MAIRHIGGFDHLPKNVANWPSYYSSAYLSFTNTGATKSIQVNNDGWLYSASSGSQDCLCFFQVGMFIKPAAKTAWLGCRMKITSGVVAATRLMHYDSLLNPYENTNRANMAILTGSELPNMTVGSEFYLEFGFNFETFTIDRRINGVEIAKVDVPAGGLRTLMTSRQILPGFFCSAGAAQVTFRDVRLLDDVPEVGNTLSGFLGPGRVVPLTLDSAAAPDWTVSGGGLSVLETLKAPLTATNTVDSGAIKTPLTVNLGGTITVGSRVLAVDVAVGAKSKTATATLPTVQAKQNNVATPAVQITADSVLKYRIPALLMTTAPNGSAWTQELIDSTDIVITPEAA